MISRIIWIVWATVYVGACTFIRDEPAVRRLSDEEWARLPELARAAERRHEQDVAPPPRSETAAPGTGTKAGLETKDATRGTPAGATATSTTSTSKRTPDTECHALVYRAADQEASERAAGRREGDATRAARRAALSCLKKNKRALNAPDDEGLTPLHVAANVGGEKMVVALLKEGADPDRTDNAKNYPADHAVERGFPRIAARLGKMTNWWEGRALPQPLQVTDTRRTFTRTWIGDAIGICTVDGRPPRGDKSNVRFVVFMTWGSEYDPCTPDPLFFRVDEIKAANAISLAMRPCMNGTSKMPGFCQ